MARQTAAYDGSAHVSLHGQRVRVWIEAPNVTAEVYVTRKQAREIRDRLNMLLASTRTARW